MDESPLDEAEDFGHRCNGEWDVFCMRQLSVFCTMLCMISAAK